MKASPRALSVFFDLTHASEWHRREWEKSIDQATDIPGRIRRANSIDQADCVVTNHSPSTLETGSTPFQSRTKPGIPTFVWDFSDFPSGRDAGFYCSLPVQLFDPTRHRTIHYPIVYNEMIEPAALSEARCLLGFTGAISSGLRGRMVATLKTLPTSECALTVRGGPWTQMYDRSGLSVKREYFEHLRAAKFILCPRGNGVGSIRLFETMQAARVPVIISDDYVLPPHVDWEGCAVRIRERDLPLLPAMIRAKADDWPRLATNARRAWEENFRPAGLLSALEPSLRALMTGPQATPLLQNLRILRQLARSRLRRMAGRLIRRR